MEDLKKLSFHEKEQLLMHLGQIYRKGIFQEAMCVQGIVEDRDFCFDEVELCSKLRIILRRLVREDAIILINEFFDIKKNGWWKGIYKESTYRRHKRYAMDEFLRCLYE